VAHVLYRKYRPKALSEVVGQEHITATLSNALREGRIGHAYLFTGPHGVGKTSVARILAHVINKLPYTDESSHLDIIEIDAASNRRIDEIRDLRERVHIAPTSAKYKVYIIDEVHMLTREAFNALLKTLEEPPAHVIFILATTEAHKLPHTIISRTQRFSFKPASVEDLKKHLNAIAKAEKLKIASEAIDLIAIHGAGSFRDSLSLLDQAAAQKSAVGKETVEQLLGVAPSEVVTQLIQELEGGTPADLLAQLEAAKSRGIGAPQLAKQISAQLRTELVNRRLDAGRAATVLEALLSVPGSSDPMLTLEIALIKNQLPGPALEPATKSMNTAVSRDTTKQAAGAKTNPHDEIKTSLKNGEELWQAVLNSVRGQHNTLYGLLRMAVADTTQLDKDVIRLGFAFSFHEKRLKDKRYQSIVHEALATIGGRPLKLESYVDPTLQTLPNSEAVELHESNSSEPLTSVMAVFGRAEVVES
jgi:DNA polymerase III subunit gamma/tau